MTKVSEFTQAERDLKKAVHNHVVWLRGLLTQKGEQRAQRLEELYQAIVNIGTLDSDALADAIGL